MSHIAMRIDSELKMRSALNLKVRGWHRGKHLVVTKARSASEFFRKTQRWHRVNRLIDRRRNRYFESITDAETGALVKEIDEPLSQHQGHGDARVKRAEAHQDEGMSS